MLQLQRPLGSELTLRLVHDISPEYLSSSEDEEDAEGTAAQRESFLLSCLSQSNINNNNSISHVSQTTCDRFCAKTERIGDTITKFDWEQNHLEQINNHINEQHLNKHYEDRNRHINLLNNNFLMVSQGIEQDSSDKENVRPDSPPHTGSRPHSSRGLRRPRRLPDIPKKQAATRVFPLRPEINEKCLADELQEALVRGDDSDSEPGGGGGNQNQQNQKQLPKIYPKYSVNFIQDLKKVKFNSVSKNTRAYLNSDNVYLQEDSSESCDTQGDMAVASGKGNNDGGDDFKRNSSCFPSKNYQDLVVTHRGMHRFIPRHRDEIHIEIGDPLHVNKTGDDLWCEGVNLRSCQGGIFPSMYATDLEFLEEEEEEKGCSKFLLRFLGSVEVNYHKGDEVLCQAINKVALSRRAAQTSVPPPLCSMEISQYGVRMFDKSKAGHEQTETFTHFFALKNITFCGHHPRNDRYFGFITKHPRQYRYACHVFLGEKSTRSVTDAVGQAFKRFYQEYMAFTHPTEDIYME